jgi:Zn-dependent protease
LFNVDPLQLVLYFIVFLFSLSFHEAAHAWTSSRFGDETGRMLGRITLNPIPHIDPIGTILFPLLGALGAGISFGWAKPVPVDPNNWTDRRTANILVSAAGPLSNLLLAVIFFAVAKGIRETGILAGSADPVAEGLSLFLTLGIIVNVVLAVFNLIPIPPLDGSHVLEEFLPTEAARAYDQIKPYGFMILFALVFLGVTSRVINPVVSFVFWLLAL